MLEKTWIKKLKEFERELILNAKSPATVKKYLKEIENLFYFLDGGEISKNRLIEYRASLQREYKAQTINVKMSAINAFLGFSGLSDCRVKFVKVQKKSGFIKELAMQVALLKDENYRKKERNAAG